MPYSYPVSRHIIGAPEANSQAGSLAVTRENRFIPLKDGVLNPAYERKLLGADVPTIINSLSIGWYESLFQSYMATKVSSCTIRGIYLSNILYSRFAL